MSYENRIALGNLVPTIGQFKVMDKIPQYQQCEVHNLVEAPAEVPEVLRHVVFNIERGQTLHETIDFLNMCPDFKNMDIIYANELDDGAVRSGNCNVAYEHCQVHRHELCLWSGVHRAGQPERQQGFPRQRPVLALADPLGEGRSYARAVQLVL